MKPILERLRSIPELRESLDKMEASYIEFKVSAIRESGDQLANVRTLKEDYLGTTDPPVSVNGVDRFVPINVFIDRHSSGDPIEETLAHELGHAYGDTFLKAAGKDKTDGSHFMASEGCIILEARRRKIIADSADRELIVV